MANNYPVETTDLKKAGMHGVISTVTGAGFLVVNSLLSVPVLGPILGGALVVAGIIGLIGKGKKDKLTSSVFIGAGVLGIASFVFKGLTGFILGLGGVGLIGYGIVNLVKFIKGLKSRS